MSKEPENQTARPSFWRMVTGALVNAALFCFGFAQLAGTVVYIQDGEARDPSVWIVAVIGIACLLAIVPVFRWSGRS